MPLLTSCFILWLLLRISNHHGAIYYYWNYKCTDTYSNELTRYQYVTIMRWYTCHIHIPLWILSSYRLSSSLPLSPTSSTSHPCFPDILLPIFVLPSPWTVPSMQRGRTLGKLLSIPSAGCSAGGPCRLLCSGGRENAKDPTQVQNSGQAPAVMAYAEQMLKQHPGKMV